MATQTWYGTSVLDATLTTASKMVNATGGAETSKTTVFINNHVYGEIRSQGHSGLSTVDSIPSASGRGWIYWPGVAGTFDAGNWSASASLSSAAQGGPLHTSITMRFSKYSGGTYTLIGSITATVSSTARTTYSFSATSMPSVSLGASDGIYIGMWWWDNNLYAVGDNPTIYLSSSSTQGLADHLQVTTSNWTPNAPTVSHTISTVSAALLQSTYARPISSVSGSLATTGYTRYTRSVSGVSVSVRAAAWGVTMGLQGDTRYLSDQVVGWAHDMGLDCFRIQLAADRIWRNYADTPDTWSWNRLDDAIYKITQAGMQAIHTVQQPPANPTLDPWYLVTNEPYYSVYAYDMATYAGAVAYRYNGQQDVISNGTNYGKLKLYSIEVGNEGSNIHFTDPNHVPSYVSYYDSPYWIYNGIAGITPSHKSQPGRDPYYYVPVVNACYDAIKANGFTGKIGMGSMWWVHPGTSFTGGTRGSGRSNYYNFLDGLYQAGVMDKLSYVNFHYYPGGTDPGVGSGSVITIDAALSDMIEVMNAYGDTTKSIWITEFGYDVPDDVSEADEATRISYITDAMIASDRVEAIVFYTLNDLNDTPSNKKSWIYNNGGVWTQRAVYSSFQTRMVANPVLYLPPPFTATIPRNITTVSASLQMVAPLTLYGTQLASPTLATGKQAIIEGGASSAGYDTTLGDATGYSELIPEGTASAWASLGALPGSATGNGYLLDSTILEGRTLQGGYQDTIRARINGGTGDAPVDFYTRIYKRSSGGVYTLIGTLSLLDQTVLNGTSQNYTLSDVFPVAVSFTTGDKLYFERFADVTVGVTGAAYMRVDSSASTTLGSDNCALVTPGYYGGGGAGQARRITSVSAALAFVGHSDTFDRTIAGGLGTASDGHTYTFSGTGSWSCEGGAYVQLTNTTTWCWAQHDSDASMSDLDITFDFSLNYATAGPGTMVFFRGAMATQNGYAAGFQNGTLLIQKRAGATITTLASVSFGITAGTWYSARVQARGSSFSLRAWTRGQTEPGTWNVTAEDTTYTSGTLGLLGYAGNAARVMQWDALTITSAAGKLRSITGISAALSVQTVVQMGVLPGQTYTNGISNFIFGVHDHGEPVMNPQEPTTAEINLFKAQPGPPPLMRTFIGNDATDAQITSRLDIIRQCGGIPLINLWDTASRAFNTHVVTMVGDGCLIYELGNEPDGTGHPIGLAAYNAEWDYQIPRLRAINPRAAFLGPAGTNESYRLSWMDHCVSSGVIPDGVALHWYSCANQGSASACLSFTGDQYGAKVRACRNAFHNRWPNRTFAVGFDEWNVDYRNPMQGYSHDQPFADNYYYQVLKSLVDADTDFACQFAAFGTGSNFTQINTSNGSTTAFYHAFGNAVGKLYVPGSTTGRLTISSVSVALKAPVVTRSITGISGAFTTANMKIRPTVSVSTALKALGVPRSLTSVSAATKAFGIVRQCQFVEAAVGTISAPVFSVSVSGVYMPVQQAGLSFDRRLDDRAGGSFEILDTSGTGQYEVEEDQQVAISDTGQNLVHYRGFVESVAEQMINGTNDVRRAVQLKDLRYLAEKKTVKEDFTNWTAGNLAAYLTQAELEGEQIKANYALRRDHDLTSFGQGTLSGVTSENGYLELARAGSDILAAERTTEDFETSDSILKGVDGVNNALQLSSFSAIKLAGTAGQNVGVNQGNYFSYWVIWTGGPLTIQSGDFLEYSLWMSSESTDLVGGVDLGFWDRTFLKDMHWPDQYGLDQHPGNHLQGWADDQWFYRKVPMPPAAVGKVLTYAIIGLESDKEGYYCLYARDIRLRDSSGNTRAAIFTGSLQKRVRLSNIGYYHVVLKPVTVYQERGTRLAPAVSLNGAGIAGNSVVSWTARETTQPQSATGGTNEEKQTPQVLIETSLDGGDTWQTCENGKAVPGLPVGTDLTNRSVQLRQTLSVGGPNPELTPALLDCSVAVESAYASSKQDVSRSTRGNEMVDGTNTYCGYQSAINTSDGWQRNDVSGLKMNGWRKTWRTGDSPNQPVYGPSVPGAGPYNGAYYIQSGANTGAHVRLTNAGTYSHASPIMIEADIHIGSADNAGLLYCTTYWGNTDNSWGYYAYITPTGIGIGRGANANANAWTSLWLEAATFSADQWYHLKVVVGPDHIHHVFLDNIEYITWTDATFTSGGVGIREYSAGTNGQAHFDNFGVANIGLNTDYTPATATRTAPAVSLTPAGTVAASIIEWNEDVPGGCTLTVQTSLDGGATYSACTNNAEIPGLSAGTSVSGTSLIVRILLTSDSISYTPTLLGLSWLVTGAFSASGSRIAPVLAADPAVTVGSSSITWDADVPAGGTLGVDSSLNGTNWTTLAANGDAVAGLTQQGDVWWDNFDGDTSAWYTAT